MDAGDMPMVRSVSFWPTPTGSKSPGWHRGLPPLPGRWHRVAVGRGVSQPGQHLDDDRTVRAI